MSKKQGEGAPLFQVPNYEEMHYVGPAEEYDDFDDVEEQPEPEEEKATYVKHSPPKKRLKPELPKYAVVPHMGKGKIVKYDGEGYFLVKVPGKPQVLVHRVDLIFLKPDKDKAQTKSTPKKHKKGSSPDQGAKAS